MKISMSKFIHDVKLSVLELSVIKENGTVREALSNSVKIAQHIEKLDFERIWFAEHHNMQYVASSAPQILIGHIAEKTASIRVGSGGIMLPNHTPLIIAEQFGTLETLYPGRIDLGLGRAPGTDQITAAAIRKNNMHRSMSFEEDVLELQSYFDNENEQKAVRAFPGEGKNIPLWILGSSPDSAVLAARHGYPYAFASHFSTNYFEMALSTYYNQFTPSKHLQKPYVMAGVNILVTDTEEEAEFLKSSLIKMFLGIVTGQRVPLQKPGPLPDIYFEPEVQHTVNSSLKFTFAGTKETVRKELSDFISRYRINELMIRTTVYDFETKLKSFSLLHDALLKDEI